MTLLATLERDLVTKVNVGILPDLLEPNPWNLSRYCSAMICIQFRIY